MKPLDRTSPSESGQNADDHDLVNDDNNPSSSSSYALLQLSSLASLNNLVELSSSGDPSNSLGPGAASLPPVPVLGSGQSARGRRPSPPQSRSRAGVLATGALGTGVASSSSTSGHLGKRTNSGETSTPVTKRKRTNGKDNKGKDNSNTNMNGDGEGGAGGLWTGVDPALGRVSGSTSNMAMQFDAPADGAGDEQGKKRRIEDDLHEHGLNTQDQDRLGGQGGGYPDNEPDLTTGLGDQRGPGQLGYRGDASTNMGMGMQLTMDQATRDGHTGMNATANMNNGMDMGGGGTGGSGGEEAAEGAESGGDK